MKTSILQKIKHQIISIICFSLVIATALPGNMGHAASKSSSSVLEDVAYNYNYQDFEAWTKPVTSFLEVTDSGYMYLRRIDTRTVVYYLDKNFSLTKRVVVPEELPVWGGFCTDGNYYYLCTGQDNPKEDNNLEVIRITKYDKDFKKLASCSVKNVNVYSPYAFSSMTAAFYGNHMVMQTGRTMYQSEDGNHHQKMLTVEVNTDTMVTENTGIDYGWVSHSLYQNVKIDGEKVVSAEMGDAYPRGWLLLETPNTFNGKSSGKTTTTTLMEVPQYDSRYQNLRASMGGFEISKDNYLIAGNSLKHDDKRNKRTTRNILVLTRCRNGGSVKVNQITSYDEGDGTASVPQLVKISDDSFMLLWYHNEKVCYTLLDGSGNIVGDIFEKKGFLSDCQPIYSDGKVIWAVSEGTELSFYSVNVSELKDFDVKKNFNGHTFHTKSVKGNNATIECDDCGQAESIKVPENFTVWSSSVQYGENYHYLPEETKLDIGQELYLWITFGSDTPYDANCEIVLENGDDSVIETESLTSEGTMIRLKALSSGVCNFKIRHKWNTDLKMDFTIISGDGKVKSDKKDKAYSIKVSQKELKYSALKKNPATVTISVNGGQGKAAFENVSSKKLKKYISVSSDGTVTFSKKSKKGTYKIKVTVEASEGYKKTAKTVKIKVK